MSKELRELLAKLEGKKEEVRSLMGEDKVAEAEQMMEEVRSLQKKVDLQRSLDESEREERNNGREVETRNVDGEMEYRDVFMKALRNKSLSAEEREFLENDLEKRAMSGLTGEDGGLVIPQDIQTKINELSRSFDALEQYVTVEPVRTRSGSRVLEKNSDMIPFVEITEMGEIPETDNPKFSNVEYATKDRAGILPLSRSLLKDSDQNILKYVTNWLGKKSKVTRNVLILGVIEKLAKQAIKSLDDIKDVLNVKLDPAISPNAILLTNQDGFNYLDKLKDKDGKYILQPDPTQPNRKLFNGSNPVVVISNRFLKTKTKKAPLIIGDLKEAIVLFKREDMELASTDVGGKAFTRNTLDLRAIQRDDVKLWDNEAAVYGEIDLSTTPEQPQG
ncbi:phage capsid family protein [Bacillus thuringiensis serovar morrisoni str. 4AA1]|uniref:phage major capsid protein n=1 Tax=Bacillus TaxID=1386 RepID=UPI0005CF240E|nr:MULTISPECIES: phage major capsid protein [Bacillus]AJQ61216.1 capsid protein [Bacillus thuringiensis serovar morrisoni]MED3097704.1 phage major capsid protein [Bacillus thuringiensis]MRA96935.1 phage major capsid protein [Bacillus thuringiensis]OTY28385.1 phage major capsid protein [Bacillus thuringiensis serovar poloniensis]RUR65219.1 phage major capsid protein [Bacillus sp. VKPM B-3276]